MWQKLVKNGLRGTKVYWFVTKVYIIILYIYSSIAPKPQKMKIIFAGEFVRVVVFIVRAVKNFEFSPNIILKICGFGALEDFRQLF